jgi:hypothetical protein
MDKFAVENVRRMQVAALKEVQVKLQSLRATHTKTASETQDMERLERQEAELQKALDGQ